MLRLDMKQKLIVAFVFLVAAIVARPASAQTHLTTLGVPSSIADPSNGFTINDTLAGSQSGVGAATYDLAFSSRPARMDIPELPGCSRRS